MAYLFLTTGEHDLRNDTHQYNEDWLTSSCPYMDVSDTKPRDWDGASSISGNLHFHLNLSKKSKYSILINYIKNSKIWSIKHHEIIYKYKSPILNN